MSEHLVQHLGNSISLSAAAPVKGLVEPILAAEDLKTSALDCGITCSGSSTSANRNSSSGENVAHARHPALNNLALLPELSGVLPTSGIYANGKLSAQSPWERRISANASLCCHYPMAHSARIGQVPHSWSGQIRAELAQARIIPQVVSTPEFRSG